MLKERLEAYFAGKAAAYTRERVSGAAAQAAGQKPMRTAVVVAGGGVDTAAGVAQAAPAGRRPGGGAKDSAAAPAFQTDAQAATRNRARQASATSINCRERTRYRPSPLRNTVALGDARCVLAQLPDDSIDLIVTSPPYFNARREYVDYANYRQYLSEMQNIFTEAMRVLKEGRFMAINAAPVLVRRQSRKHASRRYPVPFDLHSVVASLGFEFAEDIVWKKPEGAGWATGRGRRFAADRNPFQYKAVPVTEYLLVYRKPSPCLLDWYIKACPADIREQSKIRGEYERTNVWEIPPVTGRNRKHPAAYPIRLAGQLIRYYSCVGEIVLDPFAGAGTTGIAAHALGRRFYLVDIQQGYVDRMAQWLAQAGAEYDTDNPC